MNGERGTSGVGHPSGCPDGSCSVGRSGLHTKAGYVFQDRAVSVGKALYRANKTVPDDANVLLSMAQSRISSRTFPFLTMSAGQSG